MTTDISERGLETLIMRHMTGLRKVFEVQPDCGERETRPRPAPAILPAVPRTMIAPRPSTWRSCSPSCKPLSP